MLAALRTLYAHAIAQHRSLVEAMATGLDEVAIASETDVLDTWAHLLKFGRWMQSDRKYSFRLTMVYHSK